MTYESIKNHIAESRGELPLSAKNENGELVIIEERKDTDGKGEHRQRRAA